MTFIRRIGGERFFIFADGKRVPGYATSDETAFARCLEVLEDDPDLTTLTYKHEKEAVVNITALRSFAKTLNGVDNTNEGGPAPFPDVSITTTTLPGATAGSPYSQQLAATGGDGGYAWTRISGTLPAGLSLSTAGLISGTPTGSGTSNFTVQADDELGNDNSTDTQALSIAVNAFADPSDNPNGLALVGSHSLASASGLPAFEVSGATYPDDYLRLTLADTQEDGGYVHIGVGDLPDAYRETNALGDGDEVFRVLEVAFEVRITGAVPYKLFRGIIFPDADPVWREAAVCPVWFQQPGSPGNLGSDPATGVSGSTVVSTGYNAGLTYLGFTPGTAEIADGVWHTMRVYLEVNSPGNADGICRVWIDGVLDIEDTGINFVDEYDMEYGWNAFFLEAFHNGGSPGGCTLDFRNLYVRGSDAVPLAITTTSLPSVQEDVAYSQTLVAVGGSEPYEWSIVAGSLAGSGLSLNSSTGAITGTATGTGTYNFTVRVEDDAAVTATQALSIQVTASTADTPDWQEDWDYASTAAMLSGIHEDSTVGPGGITLLTGLTETPWGGSKAMRCTFLAAGSGTDHQVGGTLSMGSFASSNQPREIWIRTWVRWSDNWSWNGPYSGGGAGHKHMLAFDQQQTGAGRWDNIMGLFGTNVFMGFAGEYGTGTPTTEPSGDIYDWTGAGWIEQWFHMSMDNTNGIWETYIDGELFDWGDGGDTDRGSSFYFQYFGLSRNQNNGKGSDQTLDWGPFQVFLVEPSSFPGS
jgi:hypothetical protein